MFKINISEIGFTKDLVWGNISFVIGNENTLSKKDYVDMTLAVLLREVLEGIEGKEYTAAQHDDPDRLIFTREGNQVKIKYLEFPGSSERREYTTSTTWDEFVHAVRKTAEQIVDATEESQSFSKEEIKQLLNKFDSRQPVD